MRPATASGRRAWLAGAFGLVPGLALAQADRPEPSSSATTSAKGGARPPRSLTLLVGGAPGGIADVWARGFAPYLERQLPRATVGVQAIADTGPLTAARMLAASPADAQLIGAVSAPVLLARAIEAGDAALLERLDWLAGIAEEPVILVAPPATGDFAALRALGANATLGVPPSGTAPGLLGDALRDQLSIGTLTFPSAAAARQAAIAGHVTAAALTLPEALAPVRDGRLVALALATRDRCPLLPDVPTLTERGVALVAQLQRGFVLPLGVPQRQRERLAAALQAAVADPEFIARGQAAGFMPRFSGPDTWPAEVQASTASLSRRWTQAPWAIGRG
ncbi:Bug family tripartite tricarboxylate transporter substrate binding protein [Humitalea sp. 24SJ18S-53]|uniref:Bug family tripartite tricarboxylate transporter substrate binding protein n=1 Tax=Humitalea sp. 24SJ18S-53 TaxID=3422307 RepID=UPI003D67074D